MVLPGFPRPRPARPPPPPLPQGWTRVIRPAPPATWTGLARPKPGFHEPPMGWRYQDAEPLRRGPQRPAQPRTPPAAYERLPPPAPAPAEQPGTIRKGLSKNLKPIATAVGMTLTLLVMIEGLGVPQDARDIVAVMIAGLTPIAVWLIPNYQPPGH